MLQFINGDGLLDSPFLFLNGTYIITHNNKNQLYLQFNRVIKKNQLSDYKMSREIYNKFKESLNSDFQVSVDESRPITIKMTEISDLTEVGVIYESFNAIFTSKTSNGLLNQGTYEIKNPLIEKQLMFIVPIGQEGEDYLYQYICSYKKPE